MIWREESQLLHHTSKLIIQSHLSFRTSSYKQLIALLHKSRNKQNLILAKMGWTVLTLHKPFQEGSPSIQCLLHCAWKWDTHHWWALYHWLVSQFAGLSQHARTCWFCNYVIACPCMSETTEYRVIMFYYWHLNQWWMCNNIIWKCLREASIHTCNILLHITCVLFVAMYGKARVWMKIWCCLASTVKPVLNGISRDQNIFPLKPGFCLIKVHHIQKLNQDMRGFETK